MTCTVFAPVVRLTHRVAIAKRSAWTRSRATQPDWRPAATGGTR